MVLYPSTVQFIGLHELLQDFHLNFVASEQILGNKHWSFLIFNQFQSILRLPSRSTVPKVEVAEIFLAN
jgi:hypothetical protein